MKKIGHVIKTIWCKPPLFAKILVGLALGVIFGLTLPGATGIGFIGECFLLLLKAIAPVLVFFVISASLGKAKKGIGGKFALVIGIYLGTTIIAALIAVAANFTFRVTTVLPAPQGGSTTTQTIGDVIMNLFVNAFANPIEAIAQGNYLGILFWSILLGIAVKVIKKPNVATLFEDISEAVSKIIHWIMELSPIGIMGLVFTTIAENGIDIFVDYGKIVGLIVGIFIAICLLVNPFIYFLLTKKNPYPVLFNCLKISGIPAFFTRSSAANIPNNFRVCDMYNIPREFSSVSIPLGSVINMNGAAVAITCYTLIACFSTNTAVTAGSAIILSIVSTLAACGTSGVANGCLLLLPLSCSVFGLDTNVSSALMGIAFTLGVVVDCFETALNSSSDALFTIAADATDKRIKNWLYKRHQRKMATANGAPDKVITPAQSNVNAKANSEPSKIVNSQNNNLANAQETKTNTPTSQGNNNIPPQNNQNKN